MQKVCSLCSFETKLMSIIKEKKQFHLLYKFSFYLTKTPVLMIYYYRLRE